MTRNNLIKRINQITEAIDSTGIGPSVELKRALVADYPQGDLCTPDSTTGQASFRPAAAELHSGLVGEDVELASPEAMARLQTMDAPSRVESHE